MGVRDSKDGARRQIVPATAEKLRELIFAEAPGAQIGSLPDLARKLGVGIVTVQQVARVLESEGLLEVKRGPGGGYYGRRPDAAVLERSLAAYMRTQDASWADALDMTSLLFTELVAAAAGCADPARQDELRGIASRLDRCTSDGAVFEMEQELQDVLFRMVDRPLFALLTRVTLLFSASRPMPVYRTEEDFARWIDGRRKIIAAILARDVEMARFEADRHNRKVLLAWLESAGREIKSS